jgi:hypothetical protein
MLELFDTYRDTLFTINTNNGVDSIHPRIINSVLAGSTPVLQRNFITDRLFEDGKSALFFNFSDQPIDQVLEAYLDDPEKAYEISLAGRKRLIESDLLDHNFRTIEAAVIDHWNH